MVYLPPLMKHVLMTWTRTSEFVYALFLCRHRGFFLLMLWWLCCVCLCLGSGSFRFLVVLCCFVFLVRISDRGICTSSLCFCVVGWFMPPVVFAQFQQRFERVSLPALYVLRSVFRTASLSLIGRTPRKKINGAPPVVGCCHGIGVIGCWILAATL